MGRQDGICPNCARRREIREIHKTAGGFVARFDYAPCQCPGSRAIAARQAANRHLAVFALAPTAISAVGGFFMQSVGMMAIGTAGLVAALLWLGMNQPKAR